MKRFILTMFFYNACSVFGQQSYTASFVAKLGTDTVIVETYNMLPNHLFGKAFLRYPEDRIGSYDFHFYPNGSIKHYSMSFMNADSSYITNSGTEGLYCENDTCTWFSSWNGSDEEYVNKRKAAHMDFVGGWTPTLALIEWNCIRLMKSGQKSLPITMINDYIGIKEVAITKRNEDTLIFGGDFLEYAKIKVANDGRISYYDGIGTPWNYIVTKVAPQDIDEIAKRMSKKPKIGIPSPQANVKFAIASDTIQLRYGRPYKRGRTIFGGIVPYDSIWRTGANDATKIRLPFEIQFGKIKIPRGEYALYTIPRRDGWTLIFNTDLDTWPTEPNRAKDFALVPLQLKKTNKPVDQFEIDILPGKNGGTIRFAWDDTEAFASFIKTGN